MGNTDSVIRSKEQSVDIEVKNAILKRLEVEGRTKTIEFVVKLCCVDHFLSRIRDHTMSIDFTDYELCIFTTERFREPDGIIFIFTLFHGKDEMPHQSPHRKRVDRLPGTITLRKYESMFQLLRDIQTAYYGSCEVEKKKVATYTKLWTKVYNKLHKHPNMICFSHNIDQNILIIDFKVLESIPKSGANLLNQIDKKKRKKREKKFKRNGT